MSFCTKCGRKLEDGEVCTCSMPKKEAAPEQTFSYTPNVNAAQASAPAAPAAKKPGKKNIVLIAAAVIVALIVIIIIATSGGSYMSPIDDVVAQINKGEKADYMSLFAAGMPDFYVDACNAAKLANPDGFEDAAESMKDKFEDLFDEYSKFKIKFEVSSKEKLDKDDLKDYQDKFADYWDDYFEDQIEEFDDYDSDDIEEIAEFLDIKEKDVKKIISAFKDYYSNFKKIKVTDGYKVKGKYIVSDGKDELNKTSSGTIYVLKINGEWTIGAFKSDTSFSFDSSKEGYKYYSFLYQYLNNTFSSRAFLSPLG